MRRKITYRPGVSLLGLRGIEEYGNSVRSTKASKVLGKLEVLGTEH
jgi:hypothetical protein